MEKRFVLLCFLILTVTLAGPSIRTVESRNLSQDEQLVWVGTGAFKDGLYDIAEAQFLHFLKEYPTHGKVYDVCYLLGKTLLAKGKMKDAQKVLSRIITENKSFEDTDYALFWLAEIETRLGNAEEAKKLLLNLTKRFPKFEWTDYSYYLLGLLDLGANRLNPAESSLKMVSASSKRQELVRSSFFWLGMIAYRKKDFEAAIRHFQDSGKDPKSIPQEYVRDGLFWLGEAQVKLGRFQEAKASYRAYYDQFKQDPLLPEIYWRLAFCDYRLGNTSQAIEILQSFKNQYKESRFMVYAHYLLGEMFLAQEDFLSSNKEFASILSSPQAQPLWGTALIPQYWGYLYLGSFDEANKVFQRLIKLNPYEEEKAFLQWVNAEITFSEGRVSDFLPYYFNIMNTRFRERALFQIGRGYFYEKKFREAITNLDILSLEFPNSKYRNESLFIKGESHVQLGDVDQAVETFDLIVKQNRIPPWALFALTQMGSIHLLRNDVDQAEKAFRTIAAEFPSHPLFYYAAFQLGNIEFRKRNITEAVSFYSMVLKGNILDLLGEVYFRFGEIFYRQEKYENALKSFETAMRYFKDNSMGFFLTQLEIGNIQKRWDKVEEAKRSYQNILDHSKDEEVRNAAKELLTGAPPP
ncbi:MAG: tetratricopeptide repeat protein [Deltaproteobacteria bacterium]